MPLLTNCTEGMQLLCGIGRCSWMLEPVLTDISRVLQTQFHNAGLDPSIIHLKRGVASNNKQKAEKFCFIYPHDVSLSSKLYIIGDRKVKG